jgi:hypothetical protein
MAPEGSSAPRTLLNLQCEACGNEFQAKRRDARFCSARCRQQSSRATRLVIRLKKLLFGSNAPQAAKLLSTPTPNKK